MADYIDRSLIEWHGCRFVDPTCENRECSDCSYAKCSHAQVMQIPPAEVVDRAEFDKMVQILKDRNERLKQENIATRAKYLRLEEEYIELRAKIEHVTEELENEARFWKEPTQYDVPLIDSARLAKVQSYRNALEIVRRITGE